MAEAIELGEPSYYDVSILKQPVWKWQIATYFYLGGLSAGAYALGRVADRVGGDAASFRVRLGDGIKEFGVDRTVGAGVGVGGRIGEGGINETCRS